MSLSASVVSDAERLRMRLRPRGPALLRQRWNRLAFIHWSVDPLLLTPLLPPGLQLDLWEGRAYVGVVPFTVDQSRAAFLPAIPGLSGFNEINVRTYVQREGRHPGVWFFSLDASSALVVWGARVAYKLPYYPAAITTVAGDRQRTSFVSRRQVAPRPHFAGSYEPVSSAAEASVGSLEFFLAERYLLYSWDGRLLRRARVWHRPYALAPGGLSDLDEDLVAAAGIDVPRTDEPLVHTCESVDVRIYAPRKVRARLPEGLPVGAIAEYPVALSCP